MSVLAVIDLAKDHAEHVLQLLDRINPQLSPKNQPTLVHELVKDEKTLLAFLAFLNNDFWRRVWVVQEVVVAAKLQFLLEQSFVALDEVHVARSLIKSAEFNTYMPRYANTIFDIRTTWLEKTPMPLLRTLDLTRDSLCGKVHDRLFGLMRLISDRIDFLWEPSCGESICSLSIAITHQYIERRSLDIIFQGTHHKRSLDLPSYCPAYFQYDKHPPERSAYARTMRFLDYSEDYQATGNAPIRVRFVDATIKTAARRIGKIQSLGRAWSDKEPCTYPKHSQSANISFSPEHIAFRIGEAVMRHNRGSVKGFDRRDLYMFTHIFLRSHDHRDLEGSTLSQAALWVRANRSFVVGGSPIQEYAERLQHRWLFCGLHYFMAERLGKYKTAPGYYWWPDFELLEERAAENMRLICLDSDKGRIHWAHLDADLDDEVFLIPGCRAPVILRRYEADGHYQVVGDAHIFGAMEGEIWETTTEADLVNITLH